MPIRTFAHFHKPLSQQFPLKCSPLLEFPCFLSLKKTPHGIEKVSSWETDFFGHLLQWPFLLFFLYRLQHFDFGFLLLFPHGESQLEEQTLLACSMMERFGSRKFDWCQPQKGQATHPASIETLQILQLFLRAMHLRSLGHPKTFPGPVMKTMPPTETKSNQCHLGQLKVRNHATGSREACIR